MKRIVKWLGRYKEDVTYQELLKQYDHEILKIAFVVTGIYTFMAISDTYMVISWIPN